MGAEGKRHYTIGVMQGTIQSDFSEAFVKGLYTCADEEEVNLIFLMGPQAPYYCADIFSSNDEGHFNYQFDSIYDYVQFSGLDALIIEYGSLSLSTRSGDVERFMSRYRDIPFLLLADVPESEDTPHQIVDNYQGMCSCMEHLLDFHHYKKIAFVCGPRYNKDSNERLKAYRDSMEAHGLSVTDDMVVYGDYSENVDGQVEFLLEKNPGLEAIVFANDNMAKAGYRVCANHNLTVGKDIAITGFDDDDFAQTMEPPMTSVIHNGFQFGYTALKNVLVLCEGKKLKSRRLPAVLRTRCSCGCHPEILDMQIPAKQMLRFIEESAKEIAEDILSLVPNQELHETFAALIRTFFSYVYRKAFVEKGGKRYDDELISIINKLLDYPYISNELVLARFTGVLRALHASTNDEATQDILADVMFTLHQSAHLKDVATLTQQVIESNRREWFVPTFTRDLINGDMGFEDTVNRIMERFAYMKIKSSYLYLFEKPVHVESDEAVSFTEKLYLVAFYNQSRKCFYAKGEHPILAGEVGFSSFLPTDRHQCLTAFVLFSGTEQYGVILCDVEQKDMPFVQTCCLQLGSLFRFLYLNNREKEIQHELHESLRVIQEQNRVLSFISEYDELTRLLNRRGFMEHALALCGESRGKTAHLVFGDLDHLKEINDCFGHAAGDFAIRSAAQLLSGCLPKDALTARIGGDEYVALALSEEADFADVFMEKLKDSERAFNEDGEQPYYVEMSVGVKSFLCDPDVDLNEMIKRSDEVLYQAKKQRRASIKKP